MKFFTTALLATAATAVTLNTADDYEAPAIEHQHGKFEEHTTTERQYRKHFTQRPVKSYRTETQVGFREEIEDETEEEALLLEQEKYYNEVVDKLCESLDLCPSYEKSYKSFEAAKPDPEQEQKVTEVKNAKEALAKQLKQEEVLQKQEAEAAAKAEEDRVKKELRANVVKRRSSTRRL